MADGAPVERLQPCLLDRLLDDEPKASAEGRGQRVVSMQRFKDGVLRDLRWLFNTSRHLESEGWDEFPHAARSVLNFGIRDLSGMMSEGMDLTEIERHVHDMIVAFEPRIIRRSLVVKVTSADDKDSQRSPQRISIQIESDLWAQPMPERFFAKTEIDVETGECTTRS